MFVEKGVAFIQEYNFTRECEATRTITRRVKIKLRKYMDYCSSHLKKMIICCFYVFILFVAYLLNLMNTYNEAIAVIHIQNTKANISSYSKRFLSCHCITLVGAFYE